MEWNAKTNSLFYRRSKEKFLKSDKGEIMNWFKLGCNFDTKLIVAANELNQKYSNSRIIEFYGSDQAHSFLAARPDFRLPDISMVTLENYVKKCLDYGIAFNYTMNSIYPGSKLDLNYRKRSIQLFVKFLEDIGVQRVTIANPLMILIIREVSNIPIEISTIAHIDTISQMKYYHDSFNIDKFCGNLYKNRAFKFLKAAADYCSNTDTIYEVMVNEFCSSGAQSFSTNCVFRDSCYLCHASNISNDDALLFNNYPMEFCMKGREVNPVNWLRSRFIRPEDLHYYCDIGINHFKITGRTGSVKYLTKIAEAYMSENWNGNLLHLWKPLETIQTNENELEFKHGENIPNKKLDGFLNRWVDHPDFDCANTLCENCKYCDHFYEDHLK